jgi:hypothetical protein
VKQDCRSGCYRYVQSLDRDKARCVGCVSAWSEFGMDDFVDSMTVVGVDPKAPADPMTCRSRHGEFCTAATYINPELTYVYPAAHHTGRAPSAPSVANPHDGIRDYRNDFLEKVSSRANPKRKGLQLLLPVCTMRPSPNLVRVDFGYLRGPPRRQVHWFHSTTLSMPVDSVCARREFGLHLSIGWQ